MNIQYLSDHKDEIDKISGWYFDEWGSEIPGLTIEEVKRRVSLGAGSKDCYPLTLVAYHESKLVAVTELKIRENKDFPQYEHWLGGIYVVPEMRSKGFASSLITKAKEISKSLGIANIYLQCENRHLNFYSSHGFHPINQVCKANMAINIMVNEGCA